MIDNRVISSDLSAGPDQEWLDILPVNQFSASASLLKLPQIRDFRGNLTFIEGEQHIPFLIERVYYLYDVPSGSARAGHAHWALKQLMIPVSGSFEVLVDNGAERRTVLLNRPNVGLFLSSLIWREITSFSAGSVCLVMASLKYDESDYIRSYEEFEKASKSDS